MEKNIHLFYLSTVLSTWVILPQALYLFLNYSDFAD